jgi:hypothetical protein
MGDFLRNFLEAVDLVSALFPAISTLSATDGYSVHNIPQGGCGFESGVSHTEKRSRLYYASSGLNLHRMIPIGVNQPALGRHTSGGSW